MNNPTEFTLQLNKIYPVKQERVFQAWTMPEELSKWWGPEGFTTTIDEMNVVVGGSYKYKMHSPDGETHILTGEYKEIVPNQKLVFTWKWENDGQEFPTTLVTIDFLEQGQSTELLLAHTKLPSEEAANNHNFGWTSSLEGDLNSYFTK